jgi:transposase-like protein
LSPPASAFAGVRFPEVIVVAVRWYLRFNLSYRDMEELLVGPTPPRSHVKRRERR